MTWWYLSTARMTIAVRLDECGLVAEAPPIARRFIGQPSRNLGRWMQKQPGFRCEALRLGLIR